MQLQKAVYLVICTLNNGCISYHLIIGQFIYPKVRYQSYLDEISVLPR